MNFLQLLTVIGLSYMVYARECKHPIPETNFRMTDFSGKWIHAAFDALATHEIKKYENSSCADLYFNLNNGVNAINKWDVDMKLSETLKSDLGGTYYLPDPSKGFIKLHYAARNYTYDFTVMCTDYTTWFAAYTCSEDPGIDSEFVFLFLRDIATEDIVISKKDIQKCYKGVTRKLVNQLTKRPYKNCHPVNN